MVDDEDKDFDLTSENEDQINEIDKMIEMECNKFNDVSSPFFSACIYCDSVDLILHILIELNGVHELAIISPMVDHSKITKMPF